MTNTNMILIALSIYGLGYLVSMICLFYYQKKYREGINTEAVKAITRLSFFSWYMVYLFIQSIKQLKNINK